MTEILPTVGRSSVNISHSDIIEALFKNNLHLTAGQAPINEEPNIQESKLKYMIYNGARMIPIFNRFLPVADEKKILIDSLVSQQSSATTYRKWYDASLQLDEVLGNNSWKLNPQSNMYDYDLIFRNLKEMQNARLSKDYKLLLYLIRTKWIRNLGNMGNIDLYRHSHVGTKKLIEEYVNECQLSLDYLIYDHDVNLDDRYLLGMLIQTRKNVGRTALVLSGGSTFGVFHIGVLITLLEANLLPRIVSGSSAGSIIASILCCHTNEETVLLLNTITERKFNIFGEHIDHTMKKSKFKNLLNSFGHLLKYGTLFDIDGLQETMVDFVGDLTFREAYNRTGKILNITVSPASAHEQTRLLNYLTAPNCLIWSAVCASCSLPGFFPSTSIYEKNPRTNEIHEWNNDVTMKYVDGSVDNDLPITRLLEMFNVDHIIAVQVNPHVIPMLKVSISSLGGEIENELNARIRDLMNNCYDFITSEIVHYLQILSEMNIYKNLCGKLITLLSQDYSGDVTILPDLTPVDFTKIFENPTPEFILDFIIRGARASWPKVTVIRNHCGVEFALDKAISLLRGRLISSANNLIGYHSQAPDKSLPMKNTNSSNSYYTLVNSPVLNDDPKHSDSLFEKSNEQPGIKRHNSTSNTRASDPEKLPIKSKRNSIGPQNPAADRKKSKGQSFTSLVSLTNSNNGNPSRGGFDKERPDLFVRFSEQFDESQLNQSDLKRTASARKHRIHFEDQNIRKAKSSSNFHKEPKFDDPATTKSKGKLKYQTERIPYYKGNPYSENVNKSKRPSFDGEMQYAEKAITTPDASEKANLPKRSNNSSLRNSFIGLNRLKDHKSSTSSSMSNSRTSSNSNSYFNLKDHPDVLKSLNSPDIRRKLTRLLKGIKTSLKSRTSSEEDFGELNMFEPIHVDNASDLTDKNSSEESEQHVDSRSYEEGDEDDLTVVPERAGSSSRAYSPGLTSGAKKTNEKSKIGLDNSPDIDAFYECD